MSKAITAKALTALAHKALAEDTVRYGRDADAYPHTKGTAYIIAEAFGITPREAREQGHTKAFMAAWREAGGTAQVKRLTAQANGTWTGEEEEAAPAPAKDAQTVEIAAPAQDAEIPEQTLMLARAIVQAGGGRKTAKQVEMVARGILAMNAAADATA